MPETRFALGRDIAGFLRAKPLSAGNSCSMASLWHAIRKVAAGPSLAANLVKDHSWGCFVKIRFFGAILTVIAFAATQAAPAFAGLGLAGAVYEQGGGGSPNNISGAVGAISALPAPSVTFTSNLVNGSFGWNGGDSQTISTFLTNDAPTITNGTGSGSDLLLTSVVNLTGSLTVSVSGSYTFGTTSDDGSVFYLQGNGTPGTGTELAAVDGTHPPQYGQSIVSLIAGHGYNIEYLYYNTACCGDGGGASAVASITGPGTVSFYTPEPGSMVVWGLAGLGMFFVARRRRQA